MADYGSAKQVLTTTQLAINATQQLRTTVNNVFEFLNNGINGSEGRTQFLQTFQDLLVSVNKDFSDLEKLGNSMSTMPELAGTPLGPAGHLCMESDADENNFYQDTLLAYQWYAKLHARTQIASSVMHSYKRSLPTSATAIVRSRRGTMNIPASLKPHSLNSQTVENFMQNSLQRQFPDLSMKIAYNQGLTKILHVTVGRTFYALILFRSLMIEKVIVRGLGEDVTKDVDLPDMHTPSSFECMRQISDHACAALLFIDQYPIYQIDVKPRFLMSWLQNHRNLFTDSCQKCGKLLKNGLPPTFRDFKSYAPYHSDCK